MKFKMKRYAGNPILSPGDGADWEALVTTNPAAWYDEENDEVLLLYRAAGDDEKHYVYFGLAKSKDGLHFERTDASPVFGPSVDGPDAGCVEDPRIVKFGEYYFVTYATRAFAPGRYWEQEDPTDFRPTDLPPEFPVALRENLTSTNLAITKDFKEWIRAGRITDPRVDDRDVIIFSEKVGGQFVTLHRPMEWCGEGYGTEHPAMWIAFSDDLLAPKQMKLLAKAKFSWECKIGGSTPPLKTEAGWLTLYHAVGPDKQYRIGAMLLDLEDPSRVLYRSRDWLYEPEESWETEGLYSGVVFPCGNVILDDTLYMYYGGGDVHCGVATCNVDALLSYLLTCPEEDEVHEEMFAEKR